MMITFDITFQNRSAAVDSEPQVKLEDILPLAFTRLCEPKEASYSLIRKYVSQYYPKLRVDIRYEPLVWALKHRGLLSLSPFSWERRKVKYSTRITFNWARNKTFLWVLFIYFLVPLRFLFHISTCSFFLKPKLHLNFYETLIEELFSWCQLLEYSVLSTVSSQLLIIFLIFIFSNFLL